MYLSPRGNVPVFNNSKLLLYTTLSFGVIVNSFNDAPTEVAQYLFKV